MNSLLILSLLDMKSFSLTQVYQFPNNLELSSTVVIRDGGILASSGLLLSSISPPETPVAALASSGDSRLAQSRSGARHSLL